MKNSYPRSGMVVAIPLLLSLCGGLASAQLPNELPGLQLWLDAEDPSTIFTDGGGLISAWEDKSGNFFHATQADAARQPAVAAAAIGGKSAIRFDSSGAGDPNSDGLSIDAGLNVGRPYTIFTVDQYWGTVRGRALQGRGQNWLIGKWGGNNAYFAGNWVGVNSGRPATNLIPTIATGTGTLNAAGFFLDGRPQGDTGVGGSPGNLQIGVVDPPPAGNPPFDEPSQVDVAEILVYNRVLGLEERNQIESYLGSKFDIPVVRKSLSARVEVFTGADPGEGLDFSGDFLHAVNARGPGGFSIGDANFTDDTGIIVSEHEILNWFPSAFAVDTDDDANLNTLMESIRWSNAADGGIDDITATLGGLTIGNVYKLQLLFGDTGTSRHWAIHIGGDRVLADASIAAYTGDSNALGAVLVHHFVATSDSLDIRLEALGLVGGDINPILQALTLENEGPFLNLAITRTVRSAADLDFSGAFLYAVNAFGPPPGSIGDANFTDDSVAGVTITAPNSIAIWGAPNLGDTSDDDTLEIVLNSIRWSDTNSPEKALMIDLAGLTPGKGYKLQLLFDDTGTARGFDIAMDGLRVINNFSTAPSATANAAVAAILAFTAVNETVQISLEGFATPFADRNPILNGFTLEETEASADSDGDGLPDQWELDFFGTDPDNPDTDDDGLEDRFELTIGSNPLLEDSDGDGLTDGEEVNVYFTDPGNPDTDLDFLSDGVEVAGGTNPLVLDTDGDGYGDALEVAVGSSPVNPGSIPPPGSYVSNFTGGDIGDGLDLDGDFLYAVNVGTNGAPGPIRDADFTTDGVPGVSIVAEFNAINWNFVNYGNSPNDNALEIALSSIRWSARDGIGLDDIPLSLSGLTPGMNYKLQLIFGEGCCPNRGFDIFADGVQIADDFRPGIAQNSPRPSTGAVVIHAFTASSSDLAILLDTSNIADPEITDLNPILNAFTLEILTPGGPFAITSISRTADSIDLVFDGLSGKFYAVDYKPTLDADFWEEVDDSLLGSGPGSAWSDTSAPRLAEPSGFYRIRDPLLMPSPN